MHPPEAPGKEQQLLQHARREGAVILVVWLVCLVWSMSSASVWGYDQPAANMSLILGIPEWVFWGIVLPWGLCLAFSVWFCFVFMADDDLGEDPQEEQHHA
jgi:hypothetical protein